MSWSDEWVDTAIGGCISINSVKKTTTTTYYECVLKKTVRVLFCSSLEFVQFFRKESVVGQTVRWSRCWEKNGIYLRDWIQDLKSDWVLLHCILGQFNWMGFLYSDSFHKTGRDFRKIGGNIGGRFYLFGCTE